MLIHKHLLITAYIDNPPTSEEVGKQWLLELVDKIGMEVFMQPVCKFDDQPDNLGLTGVIGLTTSHISFHAWSKSDTVKQPFINIDVYSCKEFDHDIVINHLQPFGLLDVDWQVIMRDPK